MKNKISLYKCNGVRITLYFHVGQLRVGKFKMEGHQLSSRQVFISIRAYRCKHKVDLNRVINARVKVSGACYSLPSWNLEPEDHTSFIVQYKEIQRAKVANKQWQLKFYNLFVNGTMNGIRLSQSQKAS